MKHALSQSIRAVRLVINNRTGFSVVEVLLSGSVFTLLLTAFVGAYLYGQETTYLAGNRAAAVIYAEEGIEAVRNIRDSAWSNLVAGTYGLATTSNQWTLTGTSDTSSIFTRQLAISAVNNNRVNVTSTVTWQQNQQRTGTVTLVTSLTNWQQALNAFGGILVYGDGSTTPLYRTYNSTANTFGSQTSMVTSAISRTFVVRTSPIGSEAIAGFISSTGVLNIQCYNGSTWSQEWSVTVGGTGADRRFDIAYETATGDVMVLYGTNTATTNELAYRTKAGGTGCGTANWATATNLDPIRTSGIVHWVKMAWDKRAGQNLVTAIWADANRDLSAMQWSGTAWGNEPSAATETSLEVVTAGQDVQDFDVEYESLSGDVMVVWANSAGGSGTNGVRYRTCDGGTATCTWDIVTTPPTFADDATNLDISANPSSNQMVFASIGNAANDLQVGYWSGSAWTNTANLDTSCNTPVAGSFQVMTGWVVSGSASSSIVVYGDQGSNNIDWVVGTLGSFVTQSDATITPAPTNPNRSVSVEMNPMSTDQLMLGLADSANDLFYKRLVFTAPATYTWTNSDGVALATTLPPPTNNPFAFAFWRQ